MNPLLWACIPSLFAPFFVTVRANTEKAIFVAPPANFVPEQLTNLDLETLTPSRPATRKSLPVAFSTKGQPRGTESWYTLAGLREGQRHEVRICWAATQPTAFHLNVFTLKDIYEGTALLQGLASFSERNSQISKPASTEEAGSILFMRVKSAADFFTTNQTLMQKPPPVDVDIILDPYVLNVFPQSLLPTAAYIICLAVGGWYISGIIWFALRPTPEVREKVHDE